MAYTATNISAELNDVSTFMLFFFLSDVWSSVMVKKDIPYQGVLACGHLHAKITLYPNPNLNVNNTFPIALSITGM